MSETNVTPSEPKNATDPTPPANITVSMNASTAVILSGFGLLASFWCPWIISIFGGMSGYLMSRMPDEKKLVLLWAIPVIGFVTMISGATKKSQRTCGLLAFGAVVVTFFLGYKDMKKEGGDLLSMLQWGAFLGIASGVVALIAGLKAGQAEKSGKK